jgi:hypothetical protein
MLNAHNVVDIAILYLMAIQKKMWHQGDLQESPFISSPGRQNRRFELVSAGSVY